MKHRTHHFQRSNDALDLIQKTDDVQEKIEILNKFYLQAKNNGFADAEENYKSESRLAVGKLIKLWFYSANALTILLISIIFFLEICSGKLGEGIINGPIIITLIGATVTQNAAAFIIYAKYAFGGFSKPPKVKSKD